MLCSHIVVLPSFHAACILFLVITFPPRPWRGLKFPVENKWRL